MWLSLALHGHLCACGLPLRIAAIPRDHCVEPFTFHDLRRTMRTRLSALPIPDEVRELMIAHRQSSLHQTYDLHRYRDEKRRGFELWADQLVRIVEPPPSTVVQFRKA